MTWSLASPGSTGTAALLARKRRRRLLERTVQITPKVGLPLAQISAGMFFRAVRNLKASVMRVIIFMIKRWGLRMRILKRQFCLQWRRRVRVAAAFKVVAWVEQAHT